MEAILFIGIQATGKSTYYQHYFANTHIRINLDMLKTRHREQRLFECCLEIRQQFVIDNTNVSRQDRQRYIPKIQQFGILLRGYYFASNLPSALERNMQRGVQAIPERGIRGTYKRLELPSYDEGFAELYYVTLDNGLFVTQKWEP
ncbi:MAG: AAA family ATPase [Caldilineaceae bacterium]